MFSLLVLALVAVMTVPPASADNLPPAGEIQSPLPGTWVGGYVSLSVRFRDLDGIASSSLAMTLDGFPVSMYVSHDTAWKDVRITGYADRVPDGPHNASASARDVGGNGPTVLNWSFSSDGVPPVVTITYPVGNPMIANGSLVLEWTGSDVGSGIDYYVISIDQGPSLNVGKATSFPFHDLAPGMHYFWVTAYDLAGNYPQFFPDVPVAVATVPTPPPPSGNATTQVTVNVPEAVPSWAVGLVGVNIAEAVIVVALALRPRRGSSGGGKPGS